MFSINCHYDRGMLPGEGGKQMLIDLSSVAREFVESDESNSDILRKIGSTWNAHEVNEGVKTIFGKFYHYVHSSTRPMDLTEKQWVLAFTAVLNTCSKLRPSTPWFCSRKGFQFLTENTDVAHDINVDYPARRPVGYQIRLRSEAANEVNYWLVPEAVLNSTKEPWVLSAYDTLGVSPKHRSEGELQHELANFILIDIHSLFAPYVCPKGDIIQSNSAVVFSTVQ